MKIGLLFATAFAPAFAQEGHHHHHGEQSHELEFAGRPHSHRLFHDVESACAMDVNLFCTEDKLSPNRLPQTMGDPFLDWILLPSAEAPPEIQDLTRMMDRLFDPIFLEPSRDHVTLFFVQEPQQAPHFMIDSMTTKVAQERQPEEIPQLALDLQKYGSQIMKKFEEDSFEHRMARRLTETDAITIQHNVNLPFGCPKNRCLRQAVLDGQVSTGCLTSIQFLESTFEVETQLEENLDFLDLLDDLFQNLQNLDVFMVMMFGTFVLVMIRTATKMRSQVSDLRLQARIMQAVYSNPEVKRQVEDELGESVGETPPPPLYGLGLIGAGGKDLKRRLMCMQRVRLFSFVLLLWAFIMLGPVGFLFGWIIVSLVRIGMVCFLPTHSVEQECECCCCGATTTAAHMGELSKEQACCTCCKGTGVCAPSCASCCGTGGCCCCCSSCGCCDGSCCCSDKAVSVKDDCTCCCCGATTAQSRAGTLTDAQVCCNCCKGTGTCSSACASCCGSSCGCCCSSNGKACELKGRGQKHVVPARNEVYEGISLQIV